MINDGDLYEIRCAKATVYKHDLSMWLNIGERNDIGTLYAGEHVIVAQHVDVLRNRNLALVLTRFGLGVVYLDVLK